MRWLSSRRFLSSLYTFVILHPGWSVIVIVVLATMLIGSTAWSKLQLQGLEREIDKTNEKSENAISELRSQTLDMVERTARAEGYLDCMEGQLPEN